MKENLLDECNLHTVVRLPKGVFNPYTSIKTNLLFFTKGEPTKEVWYYEHPSPPGAQKYPTKKVWYYKHPSRPGCKSYSKTKPLRIEEFETERKWWKKRKETDFAWKV